MVITKCLICKKEYKIKPYRIKTSKYCSFKCNAVGQKGKIVSSKVRKKISISLLNNCYNKGENCYNWNGGKFYDKSGYVMILSPNHP